LPICASNRVPTIEPSLMPVRSVSLALLVIARA
jgi:hypothetical protein